jgi:hypothetical protein
MGNYQPMTRETHVARGHCCKADPPCFHCPYREIRKPPPMTIDPRIEQALKSGETMTIYSDRQSLVPSVTLLGRVTIIYKEFKKDELS